MGEIETRGIRTATGQFVPGISGNPNGRRKVVLSARLACRALNDETLAVLVGLMRNSDDDKVKAQCAMRIRDEANGKPCSVTEMPAEDVDEAVIAINDEASLLMAAIERAKQLSGSGN